MNEKSKRRKWIVVVVLLICFIYFLFNPSIGYVFSAFSHSSPCKPTSTACRSACAPQISSTPLTLCGCTGSATCGVSPGFWKGGEQQMHVDAFKLMHISYNLVCFICSEQVMALCLDVGLFLSTPHGYATPTPLHGGK